MRATPADEAECARAALVEHQFFAQQRDRLGGLAVQLAGGGDRVPGAPQQLARRRVRSEARQ
jgi:hypothetical protein